MIFRNEWSALGKRISTDILTEKKEAGTAKKYGFEKQSRSRQAAISGKSGPSNSNCMDKNYCFLIAYSNKRT